MLNAIPYRGQIVRVGVDVGKVLDIFRSDTTTETLTRILFVKNIFKAQGAEVHSWERIAPLANEASPDDLSMDVRAHESRLIGHLAELLKAE